jgi:pSer/pThr/pTyr-binding forkhead associated (FHA) protein
MRLSNIKQRLHTVKQLIAGPLGPDANPLELRAAVLDALEKKVAPMGRGRRMFPYDHIDVQVLTLATADRPALELAFADFDARLRERLQELRCDPPQLLEVRVSFLKNAPADWADGQLYSIDYQRRGEAASSSASNVPTVRINVLKGTATKKGYTFKEVTILIGRTSEVREPRGRQRQNHVAFADENSSVSRAHARLKYDASRRHYHVLDDGSLHGTVVVRGGETIQVPKRDPRGVLIRSGDEIRLGDASIRVVVSV